MRSESISVASLSGSNRETEMPLVVDLFDLKPSVIEFNDVFQVGYQTAGGRLDFKNQLAIGGLPLVERLCDLELFKRPHRPLGRRRVHGDAGDSTGRTT